MNNEFEKYTSIDRAINEFVSGRPIIVNENKNRWIFFSFENFTDSYSKYLKKPHWQEAYICLTNKKIQDLFGQTFKSKGCLRTPYNKNKIKWLQSIHNGNYKKKKKSNIEKKHFKKAPNFFNDIIELTKHARVLPCVIGFLIQDTLNTRSIINFNYQNLKNQNIIISNSTKMICKSKIPLASAKKSEIIIFKSFVGGLEHIVIKIGLLNKKKSINLRIQSACLTGEVFHSMKCDCNEQLHQSIEYISNNGGGIIIHLEQEGRGIGLINKIRAYNMQKKGLDTFESNHKLGFLDDERNFNIAIKILKYLDIKKVNIITNNYDKIKSLKNNKIKINKVIHTYPTLNKFNIGYLNTRVKKSNYKIKIKKN